MGCACIKQGTRCLLGQSKQEGSVISLQKQNNPPPPPPPPPNNMLGTDILMVKLPSITVAEKSFSSLSVQVELSLSRWSSLCPVELSLSSGALYVQMELPLSRWSSLCPGGALSVQVELSLSRWSSLYSVDRSVKWVALSDI